MIPHAEIRISRRDALKIGILSPLALAVSSLTGKNVFAAQEDIRRRLKPVILVHLVGGASYKETFNPDPAEAPAEFRGEYSSIHTTLPGCRFSEHWPHTARQADQMTVIRSINTENADHVPSAARMLMSKRGERIQALGITWGERAASGGPPYNLLNIPSSETSTFADFYPPHEKGKGLVYPWQSERTEQPQYDFDPEIGYVVRDENGPGRYVPPALQPSERFEERAALLRSLEQTAIASPVAEAMDRYQELAIALLSGRGRFLEAFNPPPREEVQYRRDIERYGDNPVGKALLTARRMAERGAGFVTINHTDPTYQGWDWHNNLFAIQRHINERLDRALSALLQDLHDERCDGVVAVLTEFGRTPRVNGSAGRDHWSEANTMLLAGGKARKGVVVGRTNHQGRITDGEIKAKNGAVANTIIHAAANGHENDFLVFNEPRIREALE